MIIIIVVPLQAAVAATQVPPATPYNPYNSTHTASATSMHWHMHHNIHATEEDASCMLACCKTVAAKQ
jgi:hypothetical protein